MEGNIQKELTWLFVLLETLRANISRFFFKVGKFNMLMRDDPLVSSHAKNVPVGVSRSGATSD